MGLITVILCVICGDIFWFSVESVILHEVCEYYVGLAEIVWRELCEMGGKQVLCVDIFWERI